MAKREQGYMVTMKMFVPVNTKDLSDTTAKSTAVNDAKVSNDLSGLVGVGDILSVDHRWTSREAAVVAAEPTQAEVDAASAGQAGEVTVDTVQPDPVDPQETSSAGEQQQDAVEEAATGRKGRRAA